MLREIKAVQQRPDEPTKRWFSTADMDLFVWYAKDTTADETADIIQQDPASESPSAFELYYDKGRNERGVLFRPGHPIEHVAVDDGESRDFHYKASPILTRQLPADWARIRRLFHAVDGDLPPAVRARVLQAIDRAAVSGESASGDASGGGYLRWIETLNQHDPDDFLPWRVDGEVVGWLERSFIDALRAWPDVFLISENGVGLIAASEESDERLRQVARRLAELDLTPGFWDEPYPITTSSIGQRVGVLDRSASARFGTLTFGQHLNGVVNKPDGLYMWVGQRAADRIHSPGKLDQLVAGGLPINLPAVENLRKEGFEEAGIPAALTDQAKPAGTLTYMKQTERGLRRDTLFCYDLILPEDFQPICTDGEVEAFHLLPVAEVAQIVRESDRFKANCNLVVIDFLIRWGFLLPEDRDYQALCSGLHRPLDPACEAAIKAPSRDPGP